MVVQGYRNAKQGMRKPCGGLSQPYGATSRLSVSCCREEEGEKIIKEENRERINFLCNFFSFHSLCLFGCVFCFLTFLSFTSTKKLSFSLLVSFSVWKRKSGMATVISNLNVLTAH